MMWNHKGYYAANKQVLKGGVIDHYQHYHIFFVSFHIFDEKILTILKLYFSHRYLIQNFLSSMYEIIL